MKITISDIAKIAGCSVSTVSKAFSDSTDINSKTKEQILKYALDSGYNFREKKSAAKGTIAALVQDQGALVNSLSFEYKMLFGFKLMATRGGYNVSVISKTAGNKTFNYQKEIVEKNFRGAFLLRFGDSEYFLNQVKNTTLPTVIFDNEFSSPHIATIGCDSELGILLAVRHLVELGHEKIAFFGGTPTAPVSIIRKNSFIASMRNLGLEIFPELIAESNFSQNYASSIIPGFLKYGATAIVCASDLLAQFALNELHACRRRVPHDVSIIGFDNVPISEETVPKLTTVDQNILSIGKNAFYLLEQLMQGVSVHKLLFKPKLIIRESTATKI